MKYLPTFQEINQNPKPAGTLDVYVSEANAVTVDGVFSHDKWESITLTIALWEPYKKTTRIHRYRSLEKFRITKKTCNLISSFIEMVNNRIIPRSINEVEIYHNKKH
jgi:hypothetical protein